MKDSLHTILYALFLGIICATALTGVEEMTAEQKQINAKVEKIHNILGVLNVDFDAEASSQELMEIYENNVGVREENDLTIYTNNTPGIAPEDRALAVAFAGPGLWGTIKGFLALDFEMKKVIGITFYEQEETPGLGGEISAEWFRDKFKGRAIRDANGNVGLYIRRNGATADNEVDAITGATMTCDKVEAIINKTLKQIIGEQNQDE